MTKTDSIAPQPAASRLTVYHRHNTLETFEGERRESIGSFYRLDKNWLIDLASPFHALEHSAKKVFLAIAAHNQGTGQVFPGQKTIASLTGISVPTVRRATEALAERGLLTKKAVPTETWMRYHYSIGQAADSEDVVFMFRDLVWSEAWRDLKPAACSLYIALRVRGYNWDFGNVDEDTSEEYKRRSEDYSSSKQHELVAWSGIHRSKFSQCIKSLEASGLVADCGNFWSIRLHAQGWPYRHLSKVRREEMEKEAMSAF